MTNHINLENDAGTLRNYDDADTETAIPLGSVSAESADITKKQEWQAIDVIYSTTPAGDRNVYHESDYATGDAWVQAAIDDVPEPDTASGGGAWIFLPNRTRKDNSEIVVENTITIDKPGTKFVGQGMFSTELQAADGLNADIIEFPNPASGSRYGAALKNIHLTGNKANNTSGDGIKLQGDWKDVVIEDVLVIECAGDGGDIRGGHGVKLRNFISEVNDGAGLRTAGGKHRCQELWLARNGTYGLEVQGNYGMYSGRARVNDQHGVFCEGNENLFCNFYTRGNSQQSAGSYDGFQLRGAKNVVEGGYSNGEDESDTSTQRYGYFVFNTNAVIGARAENNLTGGFDTNAEADVSIQNTVPAPYSGTVTVPDGGTATATPQNQQGNPFGAGATLDVTWGVDTDPGADAKIEQRMFWDTSLFGGNGGWAIEFEETTGSVGSSVDVTWRADVKSA